jgi:hypothetical protein
VPYSHGLWCAGCRLFRRCPVDQTGHSHHDESSHGMRNEKGVFLQSGAEQGKPGGQGKAERGNQPMERPAPMSSGRKERG